MSKKKTEDKLSQINLSSSQEEINQILGDIQKSSDSEIKLVFDTDIKPEQKSTFINELIKKSDVLEIPKVNDIVSSPVLQTPQSATHYARRNISSLKDRVSAVLARKTSKVSNVDAVNIEERGVFRCHSDKPIKN